MKPTFAKMGLKINNSINTITIGDQEIEIKQYLPIGEKLNLIGDVINSAADANNFSNPLKLDMFTKLEIVFRYTNITFTDKQKEDLVKLYDILESNGVFEQVINAMDGVEYNTIVDGIDECVSGIYAYNNSALGIMSAIGQDYADLDFNAADIQAKLADEKNLELLRNVLTKLG